MMNQINAWDFATEKCTSMYWDFEIIVHNVIFFLFKFIANIDDQKIFTLN